MKRYVTNPPATPREAATSTAPEAGTFDVDDLLAKSGEILRREVLNLMSKSSGGKLNPTDARDLVSYIKLLTELKQAQDATLTDLTDEELEALKTSGSTSQATS